MTAPARSPLDDALDRLESGPGYMCSDREYESWSQERDEALATVRSGLERLREERDTARRDVGNVALARMSRRAFAAETEVRRLTEGLRWVEEMTAGRAGVSGIADHVRALLSASPTDGGRERMLVSVNHASNPTDIVGRSAICPDCGNALIIATVPPDGGGAK